MTDSKTWLFDGDEYDSVRDILLHQFGSEEEVERVLREEQAWPATEWPHPSELSRDSDEYDIHVDKYGYGGSLTDDVHDAHDCLNHLEIWADVRGGRKDATYRCTWEGEVVFSDGSGSSHIECESFVTVTPK